MFDAAIAPAYSATVSSVIDTRARVMAAMRTGEISIIRPRPSGCRNGEDPWLKPLQGIGFMVTWGVLPLFNFCPNVTGKGIWLKTNRNARKP